MLDHRLLRDVGILVLRPDGPLEAADLAMLGGHVETYVEQYGPLHGVFIYARTFPGWKEFGALLAHLKCLGHRHRGIEKVAILAGSGFAAVMPHIASHFVSAQVMHFGRAEEYAAWEWLMENGSVRTRAAA